MLVGDHPPGHGPDCHVDNPTCTFRWVFECTAPERQVGARPQRGRAAEQCGRRYSVDCAGGQHILLDEAIAHIQHLGWRLSRYDGQKDTAGWRCSDHSG